MSDRIKWVIRGFVVNWLIALLMLLMYSYAAWQVAYN